MNVTSVDLTQRCAGMPERMRQNHTRAAAHGAVLVVAGNVNKHLAFDSAADVASVGII